MSDPRPVAWWGMLLTVMVLATLYSAMYFTYVYIRVASAQWPPEGVVPPSLGTAGLAVAVLAGCALAAWVALRAPLAGLTALVLLAGTHVGLVVADWRQPGFDPAAHAYGSASVVLPAVHLSFVVIGLIMGAVLLALSLTGRGHRYHVGMRSLALWWYATAAGGSGLLVLVYGLPHIWGSPWPAA